MLKPQPKTFDSLSLDEKIEAVERAIKLQSQLAFIDECTSYHDPRYDPDGDGTWKNFEKSNRLHTRLRELKAERDALVQVHSTD